MPTSSFTNYLPQPERYDEVFGMDGRPRPHWKRLADAAARASRTELSRRAETIRHAVEQDGVTYNIYADPKGADRPWEVDLLPLIISTEEWRFLAKAVQQRARLLNAVLADLYGGVACLPKVCFHLPSSTVITIICGLAAASSRPAVIF